MSGSAQSNTAPAWRAGFSDLELWRIDLVAAGSALRDVEQATPRLSAWEREKALTIADTAVAAEWLAAHVGLRILIERAAGVRWRGMPFERGRGAKPHLKRAPITFSLSHVPGRALIGLSRNNLIGVDLERTRPVRVRPPRRASIEFVAGALNTRQPLPVSVDARFLQSWVRLEALAKADGRGIGRLLTQLGIVGGADDERDVLVARLDKVTATVPPFVIWAAA